MSTRNKRITYEPDLFGGKFKSYKLFDGITVSEGGWYEGRSWMTAKYFEAAVSRWAKQSYETGQQQPDVRDYKGYWGFKWVPHQCGGCRWFAAFNLDYGFCCSLESPNDGRVVFEHGGCVEHSYYNVKGEGDE